MSNLIDLRGKRFGMLIVTLRAKSDKSGAAWQVLCDCGNTVVVSSVHLKSGHTKSCGCQKNIGHPIHGESKLSKTYKTWKLMRARCNNVNDIHFKWYGLKGITVCPEWDDYKMFKADMGNRPEGKTLDRIDNERGYSRFNCRWATPKEQAKNNRGCFRLGNIPHNKFHGAMRTVEKLKDSSSNH